MESLDLAGRMAAAARIEAALTAWAAPQRGQDAAALLMTAGVAASALAGSADLVASPHLKARGFWDTAGSGVLPGLPWQASFGRQTGPAPALGEHTDDVLTVLLGMDQTIRDEPKK